MQKQQRAVKIFVYKDLFRKKTIIDRPFEKEDSAQIEGTLQVRNGVRAQEWQTQDKLCENVGTNKQGR